MTECKNCKDTEAAALGLITEKHKIIGGLWHISELRLFALHEALHAVEKARLTEGDEITIKGMDEIRYQLERQFDVDSSGIKNLRREKFGLLPKVKT